MEFRRPEMKKIYTWVIIMIIAFQNRVVHMATVFIENVCIVLQFTSLFSRPHNIFLIKHRMSGGGRGCLLYTSPSPRDGLLSRMPSSA